MKYNDVEVGKTYLAQRSGYVDVDRNGCYKTDKENDVGIFLDFYKVISKYKKERRYGTNKVGLASVIRYSPGVTRRSAFVGKAVDHIAIDISVDNNIESDPFVFYVTQYQTEVEVRYLNMIRPIVTLEALLSQVLIKVRSNIRQEKYEAELIRRSNLVGAFNLEMRTYGNLPLENIERFYHLVKNIYTHKGIELPKFPEWNEWKFNE